MNRYEKKGEVKDNTTEKRKLKIESNRSSRKREKFKKKIKAKERRKDEIPSTTSIYRIFFQILKNPHLYLNTLSSINGI